VFLFVKNTCWWGPGPIEGGGWVGGKTWLGPGGQKTTWGTRGPGPSAVRIRMKEGGPMNGKWVVKTVWFCTPGQGTGNLGCLKPVYRGKFKT